MLIQLLLRYKWQILLFVGGMIAALSFAWWAWKPTPPKPETYKQEVKQADGSVVLEKKPDPEAKPAQHLPTGAKLVRKATVTVQAKMPTVTVSGTMTVESVVEQMKSAFAEPEKMMQKSVVALPVEAKEQQSGESFNSLDCPPVTVDLSLVEMPDKSQRVIASSDNGVIIGGVDIPVRDAEQQIEPKKWAAGAAISTKQNLGVWVDRDLGFVRIGAQINTTGNDGGVRGVEAWGRVGILF